LHTLTEASLSNKYEHIRPLPVMFFFYVFGILLGSSLELNLILLFSFLIILLILTITSYLKRWEMTTVLFFIIFILIGILNVNLHNKPLENQNIANFVDENKITIVATVLDQQTYPENDKLSLKVKANHIVKNNQKIKTCGLLMLNIYDINEKYTYGDVIKIKGQLKKPMEPNNFGDFNYKLYLAQKNIFTSVNVWSKDDISIIDKEKLNPLINMSLKTRDKIKNIISNTIPAPYHSLLIGMMLGEKTLIPQELKTIFIDAGVMHILAVSGLHVGMIAGFLLLIFGMFKIPKNTKYISVLLLLFSYAAISGYRPSVMRATIMFSILIIGKMINRDRNVFISLFFAGFIILLCNPLVLYDSGFLLSFSVTFFILYLVPVIKSIFSTQLKWMDNALSISIAAWLGLFPLSAYFFNKVSIIALIANLFIVPLAGAVVLLGFFTFFIGLLSIRLAGVTAFLSYCLLRIMVFMVQGFSALPFSFITIGQPPIIIVVFYYFLLIFLIEIYFKINDLKKFRGKAAVLIFLIIFIVISVNIFFPVDDLRVHYLNVGEGDCALIQIPKHFNILIDGGGSPGSEFDVGNKIVIPYLKRNGIHKIDVLILSHPHLDHLEGLLPILREFNVKMVMDNGIDCNIPEYTEFLSIIDEKEIPYHRTISGDHFKINQFTEILILGPNINKKKLTDNSDFNNASIVLKLFYKNSNFLFTGDAEEEAENSLLKWGNILNCDVLKVAHHGSDTSTNQEFLKKVNPVIAVISTGKNNYGHPSEKVIQRLKENETKIFRTDLNGTIVVKTNGNDYLIKTSRGQ